MVVLEVSEADREAWWWWRSVWMRSRIFKLDAGGDREPIEGLKDRGRASPGKGACSKNVRFGENFISVGFYYYLFIYFLLH